MNANEVLSIVYEVLNIVWSVGVIIIIIIIMLKALK